MPKHIEHRVGDRFGLWTIVQCDQPDSGGNLRWICRCQCGTIKSVNGTNLRNGKSRACKSCGGKRTPKLQGNQSPHWTGCGEISGKHWDSVLRHAKDRGYLVEITIQDAWTLFLDQNRKCALSGVSLEFGKEQTASLDRIDSTKGYVPGNIQWVHKTVNWMKGRMSDQELLVWCKAIVDRQLSVLDP